MSYIKSYIEEQHILNVLKHKYESEGYAFFIQPPEGLIPKVIADYKVDALATNNTEKIIIEVVRDTQVSQKKLVKLSGLLRGLDDWVLKVIYADSFDSEDESYIEPEIYQISEAVKKAEKLNRAGFKNEAFISYWITLEALTVLLSNNISKTNTPILSPKSLVSFLEQHGYSSFKDSEKLRIYANIRNKLVHGDLGLKVQSKDIKNMSAIVNKLVLELDDMPP